MGGESAEKRLLHMDKSCHEPICSSKKDAMRAMFSSTGSNRAKTSAPTVQQKSGDASSSSIVACPPDRDELGRHSWTLLHTMAAYYPDQPDDKHRERALNFVRSL